MIALIKWIENLSLNQKKYRLMKKENSIITRNWLSGNYILMCVKLMMKASENLLRRLSGLWKMKFIIIWHSWFVILVFFLYMVYLMNIKIHIITILVKTLIMLVFEFWLKKLTKITRLLNLMSAMEERLLGTVTFLAKAIQEVGQEKY